MPYIKQDGRGKLEESIKSFDFSKMSIGDLNYIITRLCQEYLNTTGKNYTQYNSVVGVLECAKLELYRRAIAPYEDKKIKENGDVYFK